MVVPLLLAQAVLVAVRGLSLHAPVDLVAVGALVDILERAVAVLSELAKVVKRVLVAAVAVGAVGAMRVTPPVRAFSMLEAAEVAAA